MVNKKYVNISDRVYVFIRLFIVSAILRKKCGEKNNSFRFNEKLSMDNESSNPLLRHSNS